MSAWTNSAAVSIEKQLFVWGLGVFGDSDIPKHIDMQAMTRSERDVLVDSVEVGGKFISIKDSEGTVYCWGFDYNKEIKIGKHSLLVKQVPKKILTREDAVL